MLVNIVPGKTGTSFANRVAVVTPFQMTWETGSVMLPIHS